MKKLLALFTIIGILGLFACGGPVKEQEGGEEVIVEEEITEAPVGDSVELIVEDSLAVEAPDEDSIAK